jgi:hypothetical protein
MIAQGKNGHCHENEIKLRLMCKLAIGNAPAFNIELLYVIAEVAVLATIVGLVMFRRSSDGIAVPASIRMNDGAILIGTINCGMSGRLENLLASDLSFIEFVSKDGHQRFVAHHQVASVEPLATVSEPTLPPIADDLEPFKVLGVNPDVTLEEAMMAYQEKLQLYGPERWSAEDIPFEFSRYAAQKTRQINMAFTILRATLQSRGAERKRSLSDGPFFGGTKARS